MKKMNWMLAAFLMTSSAVFAQQKGFGYKFYGQIRTDIFYNSRDNVQSVDGLFYMYPKDEVLDPNGKDLNGADNSNMYAVYSRLGVDVTGPSLGKIKTSAKVEFDFRGNGNDNLSVVRLRHAYLNLDWGKSKLLVGQTWHPFYGEVAPQILNLNMGAPFQPFGRAPQLRYRYNEGAFQLTAAALWQSQYKTYGPTAKDGSGNSRIQQFHKNSNVPELSLGVDYKANGWIVGAGVDMLSIVPRTQAVGKDGATYQVDERLTTVSYEAHVKYTGHGLYVAAKSVLGSNMTHLSMTGGYGISGEDATTGERDYTPFRNSSTWFNIAYGKKWRPALFVGYMKNLGTSDELVKPAYGTDAKYGTGQSLEQLLNTTVELTYNLPNWKFGAEYAYCTAWYGDRFDAKYKATDSHSVGNHRLVLTALFTF